MTSSTPMSASQKFGSFIHSPVGKRVWERVSLLVPVVFVGLCCWFGGILWERAHYTDPNWFHDQCVKRLPEPIPDKLE